MMTWLTEEFTGFIHTKQEVVGKLCCSLVRESIANVFSYGFRIKKTLSLIWC